MTLAPAVGSELDFSQARSLDFWISSGRVCRARYRENLVNHAPCRAANPEAVQHGATEPAGWRRVFAASSTGIVAIRSKRRCRSDLVHTR